MNTWIALFLFALLAGIALLHAYWAFGGTWPGHDEESLAKTVIGSKGATKLPPFWLTLTVASLILFASLFPLAWTFIGPDILPFNLVGLGMVALTIIFVGRGAISFTGYFKKTKAEEPFVTLDRKYYGPLCLLIGAGFLLVLFVD